MQDRYNVDMNEKTVKYFGYAGSTMSVLMYVSYIPQIMNNLNGVKGSPIQPLVACINCLVWTIYGLNTKPKEWPIIIANIPGIFLGAITFITVIMH